MSPSEAPSAAPTSEPLPLALTGERTLPGIAEETYWYCRHVAGYRWAIDAIAGSAPDRVLDSGSGEGYGTAALAAATPDRTLVAGVDVYPDAAHHAAATYSSSGPVFLCADASSLPFGDGAFDAVVSLQVIEHLSDPDAYAAECARVLRRGGTFACATPNRITFTPPGRPKNPFHVVEFSGAELADLLGAHMREVEVCALGDTHPGLADSLIDAAFAGTPPPAWAAAVVPTVGVDDFCVHDDVDAGLDLLARCSR